MQKKVLPALEELAKRLDIRVIALGRRPWDTKKYIEFACPNAGAGFKEKISYKIIDFDKKDICPECISLMGKNKTSYFYLSLPPELQPKAISFLGGLKKQGHLVKILLEKPFGSGLSGAKKLLKLIRRQNLEKDILISDHYLFKDTVLSLHAQEFSTLKIVSIESIGLEGRSYYDGVGALRDMVQSHFLNIALKLVPFEEIYSAKVVNFDRAQYGNGKNTGYAGELKKKSGTETFVNIKFLTKGKKTIEFITGKGFKNKESFVEIDKKRLDLEKGMNPYISVFESFFAGSKKHFPSISQSLGAWAVIEKLKSQEPKLSYYEKGAEYQNI